MGKFYERLLEGLTLYVRHGAWLDTVPEEPNPKPGAKPNTQTRRELSAEVEMPECDAPHILEYLYQMGPTGNEAPLSFGEVLAWSGAIGIELEPWEIRFIRELSMAYLAESRRAVDPKCPPPYESGLTVSRRILSQSLKDSIKGLASL